VRSPVTPVRALRLAVWSGHCRDLGQGRIWLRHFMHHPRTTVLHPSTMVHLHRCITIPIIHATTVTAVGNIGVRTPRTRVVREAIKAYPTPRSGLTYRPTSDASTQTRPSQAREANGWTRDLSGAGRSWVRESLICGGVRANLLAGVTPSEAVIVDVAAARGVEVVRSDIDALRRPPRGCFQYSRPLQPTIS
jgi:hypothetical protein